MKTITVRVQNDKDAELLKNILSTTKFEDKVEAIEDDDNFTDEEFQIYEERIEEYLRNPSSATSLEELKKELKEKYDL
jgi:hypothetical protein